MWNTCQRHKLELARNTNANSHQKSTRTKKKKSHEGRVVSRKCGHRYIPAETCITHFIKQCERNIKRNTHNIEPNTNIPRVLCISSQVYQSELVRANIKCKDEVSDRYLIPEVCRSVEILISQRPNNTKSGSRTLSAKLNAYQHADSV